MCSFSTKLNHLQSSYLQKGVNFKFALNHVNLESR